MVSRYCVSGFLYCIKSFSYFKKLFLFKLYIHIKGKAMNKAELNTLLKEANILLDEIEVTIENMFYAAYKSQN